MVLFATALEQALVAEKTMPLRDTGWLEHAGRLFPSLSRWSHAFPWRDRGAAGCVRPGLRRVTWLAAGGNYGANRPPATAGTTVRSGAATVLVTMQ